MAKATVIAVRGLKLTVPLAADQLPPTLVPPEPAPAGEPVVDLALEGTPLVVQARLNGKSVRKVLKQVAEHGAANVVVVLQGALRPAPGPGQPLVLDQAGLAVTVKAPKPAEPTATEAHP